MDKRLDKTNQGAYCVCIGTFTRKQVGNAVGNNNIVINATGGDLVSDNTSIFYVRSIALDSTP